MAGGKHTDDVSPDPIETQCRFAEHYQAKFPILADPEGAIARAYGVKFAILPRVKRVTFVIDPEAVDEHYRRAGPGPVHGQRVRRPVQAGPDLSRHGISTRRDTPAPARH